MEYYHSQCGHRFYSGESFSPNDPCPRCGQAFTQFVKTTCKCSRNHVYITDVNDAIGSKSCCPFTGELVTTAENNSKQPFTPPPAPPAPSADSPKPTLGFLLFVVLIIWLTPAITGAITLLLATVSSIIIAMIEFLPTLVWGIITLSSFVLLCVTLHVASQNSINQQQR